MNKQWFDKGGNAASIINQSHFNDHNESGIGSGPMKNTLPPYILLPKLNG